MAPSKTSGCSQYFCASSFLWILLFTLTQALPCAVSHESSKATHEQEEAVPPSIHIFSSWNPKNHCVGTYVSFKWQVLPLLLISNTSSIRSNWQMQHLWQPENTRSHTAAHTLPCYRCRLTGAHTKQEWSRVFSFPFKKQIILKIELKKEKKYNSRKTKKLFFFFLS